MLLCFVKCYVQKNSYQEQKACLSANRVSHHAIDNQVLCQLTKQFVTRYFPLTLWLLKLPSVCTLGPLLHANHTISRSFYSFFLLLHIPWKSSKVSSSSIFKGWPPFKKNCGCSMFITHPLNSPRSHLLKSLLPPKRPFCFGCFLVSSEWSPSDLN